MVYVYTVSILPWIGKLIFETHYPEHFRVPISNNFQCIQVDSIAKIRNMGRSYNKGISLILSHK